MIAAVPIATTTAAAPMPALAVGGPAESFIHAPIASQLLGTHNPFVRAIALLDRIGVTIGATRVSLWSALVTIIVIVVMIAVARVVSRLGRRLLKRTRLDPAQRVLGEKLWAIFVWVSVFLIGIDLLGISLTAFTVFSGAFGLAIGFGLQKTFGNLIAGLILLMDRSIKPGDVIGVNDGKTLTIGEVKKIGVRAVSVTTRDAKEYLIPNEILMTSQVENWSYSSKNVRVKVEIGIAYGSDIDLAERLMLEAAATSARVLTTPKSTVWLRNFGDNAIEFDLLMWIDDPEDGIGNLRSDVLKALWKLFVQHGIELPFPQRDIYVRQWPKETPMPVADVVPTARLGVDAGDAGAATGESPA